MLKLPGRLNAAKFLAGHWQKKPLFMPQALDRLRPAITRNELGWLATLDDVESRLVFTERSAEHVRYRAEMGPFDPDYLADLPRRDWTLLVHDVEKHLPVMRGLLTHVPFIPDWRIDDLMVSFAAPGGGVGPHKDNYDVFLCQGIGVREWRVSADPVANDPKASDDLALTHEFRGDQIHETREGDVLYLPPGIAHWGTAKRACMTYSIGMRAPQLSDLDAELPDIEGENPFYVDPDLTINEARPGLISREAAERALVLLDAPRDELENVATALGRFVTETKDWITPDRPSPEDMGAILDFLARAKTLNLHGMARVAFDDRNAYVNGRYRPLSARDADLLTRLCRERRFSGRAKPSGDVSEMLLWMLKSGAFEIPGKL